MGMLKAELTISYAETVVWQDTELLRSLGLLLFLQIVQLGQAEQQELQLLKLLPLSALLWCFQAT